MFETRLRSGPGEGLTIARRLKIMRRRTARWFLPRVRPPHEEHPAEGASEPCDPAYAARGVKPPYLLN